MRVPPMVELRPYQQEAVQAIYTYFQNHSGNPLVVLPTGCHARGTLILMADGSTKAVEHISVGDQLMGPDSRPRTVLHLCRGRQPMYRITPKKRAPFVVNEDHVLALRCGGVTSPRVFITVGKFIRKTRRYQRLHKLEYLSKIALRQPGTQPDLVGDFTVEAAGEDDYFGFTLDGDHLYLDAQFLIHHNSGKSLTLAAFIKGAIDAYPGTRIVMLTHVKELIQQDAQAILRYWNDAPIGIWSAGLGKKTKHQITVAGIQSIHKWPTKFGGTDLVIIDEAHLLSKNSDTMYGRFMQGLRQYNPCLKIIGLTATPYRMDSGLLTQGKDRIFTDIAYEADVGTLIKDGWLCPLVARNGATRADLSEVHTRGGEFVASELQVAMDKDHLIQGALDEVARYAHDRKHILGFCAGVEHARHCAEACLARGWTADYVTGDMAAGERDAKINAFKSGRTRILFNAMLLTTGFDAPHIDCLLLLRPTKSTGLYVQIMGRGLRKHPSKENTLVLDFAGNVERHGPIDQIKIKPKSEKGEGVSVAPVKECANCNALVHAAVRECPECGHAFPEPETQAHGTDPCSLRPPGG